MAAPLPVYLVKGDDPVLRAEATRNLIHELVGEGDPGLMVEEHEPGDEVDATAIADAAQTPPFLTDRRVVVARDITAYSSEALEPLLKYLEDPLPTTSLVLVAGDKGRMSQKLANAVKKAGHVVETGVPANKKGRGAWLADQLKGAPVKLDSGAAALVDQHLGEDLGRLSNLLEALGAAYGHGTRVTADDLKPFLGEAGSVPPWELTDAIDGGDTALAVELLHRMLHGGDRHPLQLMATLHGHYARMLRLDGADVRDEGEAAQVLGMKGSTFPAKKALTQARRLGHDGVSEAIRLLAEADLDLRKFSKDWPEQLVMEVLVARLSRLGPRARAGSRR
jgi:DNA polymerase III subunit delta